VNGKTGRRKEKENIHINMGILIVDIGKRDKDMDREFICGRMETNIEENGRLIKYMA
jgi:hypothetical protein